MVKKKNGIPFGSVSGNQRRKRHNMHMIVMYIDLEHVQIKMERIQLITILKKQINQQFQISICQQVAFRAKTIRQHHLWRHQKAQKGKKEFYGGLLEKLWRKNNHHLFCLRMWIACLNHQQSREGEISELFLHVSEMKDIQLNGVLLMQQNMVISNVEEEHLFLHIGMIQNMQKMLLMQFNI